MPASKVSFVFIVLMAFVMPIQFSSPASAEDWTFKPRVSATGEYNDNVEEVDGGEGDYLAIVKPGFSATYDHARVLLDLSYDFEYKKYMNQVRSNEQNHWLDAMMNVEAIKELFFIEVTDTYKQVYQDVNRGDFTEGDTTNGTTAQNIFGVKPYFTVPVHERTKLTFGGEFKDIWYEEDGNIDKRNYSLFADVDHELSDVWMLMVGTGYEKQDPRFVEGGYERYNVKIGTKYTYAERSFFLVSVEPTYTDYKISGSKDKQYNPYNVEINHAFSDSLIGKASTSMDFAEDPTSSESKSKFVHKIGLVNEYERGNVYAELSYQDYASRNSSVRTAYWRPKLGGKHSLTERFTLDYNVYADLYSNSKSDVYLFSLVGLRYSLNERTSAGLTYRFKSYDRAGSGSDYTSNTIGLNIKWEM